MTKAQYLAMGASPDVAEVLSTSDRELATMRMRLMRQISERALQDEAAKHTEALDAGLQLVDTICDKDQLAEPQRDE